jgi:hypothetical protein
MSAMKQAGCASSFFCYLGQSHSWHFQILQSTYVVVHVLYQITGINCTVLVLQMVELR